MIDSLKGLPLPIASCLLALGLACWLWPSVAECAKQPSRSADRPVSEGMSLMRKGIDGDICTLTFDDGPSRYTAELMDILNEYRIPATFFVVGTQVKRRPDLIRRMLAEGHEVGNHSYSHHTLREQTPEAQKADLRKLDTLLRELGANPRFVRPPYGFYDHNTVNVVQEMDGHMVLWSVDSQDWRRKTDLEDILSNMQTLYTGAPLRGVFLFHDTHRRTVEHMPQILDALKATGCHFVTLSEYINMPKAQPEPEVHEAATDEAGDLHENAEHTPERIPEQAEKAPEAVSLFYGRTLTPTPLDTMTARIFDTLRLSPEKHNGLPH